MVAALYIRQDSVYNELQCDCWAIDRDASLYNGPHPIVAHPPCRSWGQLRGMANPRSGEKALAVMAIAQVRKWGGVLEHPKGSQLFSFLNLPKPGRRDEYGGFCINVDQYWWGHKAMKNTTLYICGMREKDLPPYSLNFDAIQYTVASRIKKKSGRRVKLEITKKEREATPIEFAKWLIEVAEKCKT